MSSFLTDLSALKDYAQELNTVKAHYDIGLSTLNEYMSQTGEVVVNYLRQKELIKSEYNLTDEALNLMTEHIPL